MFQETSGYDNNRSMISNRSAIRSFKRIKLNQKSTSPQKELELGSERLSKVSRQLVEYEEIELEGKE